MIWMWPSYPAFFLGHHLLIGLVSRASTHLRTAVSVIQEKQKVGNVESKRGQDFLYVPRFGCLQKGFEELIRSKSGGILTRGRLDDDVWGSLGLGALMNFPSGPLSG
jgi:hypothetical protein